MKPHREQQSGLVHVEDIPQVLSAEYIRTSRGRQAWPITVDLKQHAKGFIGQVPSLAAHQLTIRMKPTLMYVRADGRERRSEVRVGEVGIMPFGMECYYDASPTASLTIYFRPSLLDEAYEHTTGRVQANVSLPPLLAREDSTLPRLCDIVRQEIARPEHPAQLLLIETITSAIMLHLVRDYVFHGPIKDTAYGLRPRALRAVLDYIDDQRGVSVSLDQLAAVAGVSRFHFARLFKNSVGVSPIQYVERQRLEAARSMICAGQETLAQIAIATGFSDQSHFTRRFHLYFGYTPAKFALERAPHIVRKRNLRS